MSFDEFSAAVEAACLFNICRCPASLLRTTKCYAVIVRKTKHYLSTSLYYKSTPPVLLCTTKATKYYASSTPYYKVLYLGTTQLRRYYSVLQNTTPVLLCTTKNYSSTSLYYKVLRKDYSVLRQVARPSQATNK